MPRFAVYQTSLTESMDRFKWAMRVIAFILMLVLAIMNLVCNTNRIYARPRLYNKMQTLKRRLPPVFVSGGLFNLKQFKSPAYSVYTTAAFVAFLGLYTSQSVHMHSWTFLTDTHRQC
jgi:hypothetical protein